jgi:hypothetical protein
LQLSFLEVRSSGMMSLLCTLLCISIDMTMLLYLKALIIVYSVEVNPSENFLQVGKPLSLSVQSAGHALHVFVNGQLQGIPLRAPFSGHLCHRNKSMIITNFTSLLQVLLMVPGKIEELLLVAMLIFVLVLIK